MPSCGPPTIPVRSRLVRPLPSSDINGSFAMHGESTRRKRAEKRRSQIGALGRDVDRSSEIPKTKADFATLAGFQRLFVPFSLRSRKG
jgi:hypothetical protein